MSTRRFSQRKGVRNVSERNNIYGCIDLVATRSCHTGTPLGLFIPKLCLWQLKLLREEDQLIKVFQDRLSVGHSRGRGRVFNQTSSLVGSIKATANRRPLASEIANTSIPAIGRSAVVTPSTVFIERTRFHPISKTPANDFHSIDALVNRGSRTRISSRVPVIKACE